MINGQAKSFASLSSGLLARKGQARPAMRPQAFGAADAGALDDLGWNDMGHAGPAVAPVPVVASIAPPPPGVPPVLRQREVLREEFEAPVARPVSEPVAEVEAPAAEVEVAVPVVARLPKAKAAFTLRLDADRHLRLRVASAIGRRSAQQIVTQALDAYLATLPQVDQMLGHMSAGAGTVQATDQGKGE
ncbi:hypothetical protein [Sphingomonas sp.]|uniref:hypothetical protein n=1 Tax=Sphingomonas sp. TaxID=28214 RepID=UPI001D7F26BD|nr:hypothetical protein [Sphingomonas sp.]MBX9796423.1 hypothetical protein [Sphingomonas sp.]